MKIVEISDNKNNIVKKHNDIIEAKGRLSETAQKMLAMLIAMIQVDDTELERYALHIETYKKEIGATNNEISFYVKQAEELMKNPFRIGKALYNWCSKVDYGSLEGYIIFDIHKDLKPYFLQMKNNFTTYNIVNVMKLKGDYTLRLYEIFIMKYSKYIHYNSRSKSYTFEIKIDELRSIINIPKSYRYNNIKVQILEVAKKQFKEKTDIQFDYKEQKIGRRVDRLIITVRENNKGSNDFLANRRAFIAYVRKHYKPNPANNVFPTILETSEGNLKVDINGNIYLLKNNGNIEEYSKERADKLWSWLYEMAQLGNLPGI